MKNCVRCHNTIKRKYKESNPSYNKRKYCSQQCWHKSRPKLKGKAHPSWKGGRYITKEGYIRLHTKDKQVLEHRIVVEQILGRPLTSNEIIHHKNGVKDDNRPSNLEVVLRTTHFGSVSCPRCRYDFKIK